MKQTNHQTEKAFREQCRRQMQRPLALRIKYGLYRAYRPVMDDAPWRSFNSTADTVLGVKQTCRSIWDTDAPRD